MDQHQVWQGLTVDKAANAVSHRGCNQLRHFLVERRGWQEPYSGAYETVYVRPGFAGGAARR